MKRGSRLIDAAAVGEMVGLSAYTVRKKARRGEIPSCKIGVLVRFDVKAIEAWIAGISREAS